MGGEFEKGSRKPCDGEKNVWEPSDREKTVWETSGGEEAAVKPSAGEETFPGPDDGERAACGASGWEEPAGEPGEGEGTESETGCEDETGEGLYDGEEPVWNPDRGENPVWNPVGQKAAEWDPADGEEMEFTSDEKVRIRRGPGAAGILGRLLAVLAVLLTVGIAIIAALMFRDGGEAEERFKNRLIAFTGGSVSRMPDTESEGQEMGSLGQPGKEDRGAVSYARQERLPEKTAAAQTPPRKTEPEPVSKGSWTEQKPAYVKTGGMHTTVRLVMAGDNLMHRSVSMSGLQPDGTYNYDYNFSYVLPYIQEADLAMINQETVIGGNWLGIQGYPCFNGRTEMAEAMVKAGFDVICAANNHILDQGVDATRYMVSYFNETFPEVTLVGIHGSWDTRDTVAVREVNGIRIAIINYTDILNIPGHYQGNEYSVDYLDYDRLAALIRKAKARSDFVVVCPHWGTEYELGTSEKQEQQASFLAKQGVDLVIGCHPHVVEPVRYMDRPDGGKMLVYFSLGNYQSIQNLEATMIGGLAQVEITKDMLTGEIGITDFDMEFLANDYRMSSDDVIGVIDYFDRVTTYPWELYSRELAATSWCHFDNKNFDDDKMFNLEAKMERQVEEERKRAGMPCELP